MAENGSNWKIGASPPEDIHREFLVLCALAASGSLSTDEQLHLRNHLAQCAPCRRCMAQYEAIVGKVIPGLGPENIDPASTNDPSSSSVPPWSLEDAEASLFARLSKEEAQSRKKIPIELESNPPSENDVLAESYDLGGDALWRHLWWQFAAGLALFMALSFGVYRLGIYQGAYVAGRPLSPAAPLREAAGVSAVAAGSAPAIEGRIIEGRDPLIRELRSALANKSTEVELLKAAQSQANLELSAAAAAADRLSHKQADLSRQLNASQTDLADLQQKMLASDDQSSHSKAQIANLDAKISALTDNLRDRDQEVAREREMLDHDRDIRDLMGARDLYIAEVYDVAKTGNTEKPFGRVFYTKGKSLVFYAYDLDERPGVKVASTFQAWGRRGPDRERAVDLGVLYQDNANKKRWVLKSRDPRTLGEIDAVFVTVEPNGGSSHPSSTPFLFAYLRNDPNHP